MTAPEMVIPFGDLKRDVAKLRLPSCCDTEVGLSVWLVDENYPMVPFDWAFVVLHETGCPAGGVSPRLRLVSGLPGGEVTPDARRRPRDVSSSP